MDRQHLNMPHQYVSGSGTDNLMQRQATASNPGMYSALHPMQHANIAAHQLYPQGAEQAHRFDPRPSPMISSLQRSRLSTGSAVHVPGPQQMQPRRVSLLRDIGRAGERDRDMSSNVTEGYAGLYPQGASRHMAASSQPTGVSGGFDRSMSILQQTASQQYQQQHHDQSSHLLPGSIAMCSVSIGDAKKDQNQSVMVMKEEPGVRSAASARLGPQLEPSTVPHPVPAGIQRQPSVSGTSAKADSPLLSPGFEQRSKEDLVQAMDKVDRELSKIQAEITRLEKKKTQLEESAKKPAEPEKETAEPQTAEPKHRDLWQIIYADNRKKAETARTVLDGVCPIYDMPLYNQPSDTKVFQDNLKKNEEMRPKLVKFFQHRRKLANIRVKYLSARYDQMMEEWQQKTEKLENNVKRKAKEAKTREFFEKLFPEVRKQREQQERVERVGSRGDTCRSDADFADIVDGLTEQENQLQHMRQLAVVPPMLLDKEDRRVVFINTNGFIMDPFEEFKESQQLDTWADHEKATFKEKYVQHPKNFNLIASFIEKKSVADCILYYYLTKKANNYKVLVRKQTLKPRKPKSGRAHASHHNDQSGSGSNSVKDGADKTDKDGGKKDLECDVEEAKVDRPPSPRMTRARKQTMNWTEEEINLVKEGFGKHGRDFSSISRMVTNKSEQQVKNFYNNYKKKHGLDQLIIDSKKKKTRSRHAALSPDTAVDDDSSSSRKNEQASDKIKLEKIDEVMEEKKKLSKDRTPSPAVASSKPAVDAVDPLASTTYRTRRTTAALAAAATQDLQEKEASNKRSADKQPSSAEPAEKKAKKNERKSRNQKSSEQARSELAKSEAVKDVVASLSKLSEEKEDASMETSEQKAPEPKTDDVAAKQGSEKGVIKEPEKAIVETKKVEESKDASKQSAPDVNSPLKKSLEDHDSSATCSADEDAPTTESITKPRDTTHSSSPYGFDDDFNDSPTRIRLERPRPQGVSQSLRMISTAASVATTTVAKSSTNAALDLVSKSTPVLSTSAVITDARPQSLPPASIAFPLTTAATLPTTSSLTVPGTGVDLSRPSSTPLYGDFPIIPANVSISISSAPLTSVYGQAVKRTVAPSQPLMATSTVSSAHHVKNINELTYSAGKANVRNPSPSFHPGSVVDLTKDNSKSSQRAPSMQEHLEASSAAGVPISRHQYHVTHPMAGSLSKDFQATVVAATEAPAVSLPTTGYSRMYSEKDKLAMKHRAAVIPDANVVPVGSLRFSAAAQKPASTQLSTTMQHDQYKTTVLPTSDQSSSKHAPLKEEILQHPVNPAQSMARLVFSPGARLPPSTTPKVSSIPAASPRVSTPLERPGSHSSEKIVPKHVTLSGGSITQGKPVFRAQMTTQQDSLDVKKEKMAAATRGVVPVPQTLGPLPMTSEVRRAVEAVAAEQFLAAHGHPGLLPHLNPAMTQFLPGFPPPVKHEKEAHSLPKAFTHEGLRRSSASPGNPMHLDPQFFMSPLPLGSIIPGIPPKGKGLEESLSPKGHGSTPPPSSSKVIERKSSHSSIASGDLSPRRPSPMVHGLEGHYKEDIKRPSSASRLTPERRSVQEKAAMMGHHRLPATSHPLTASKQRSAAEPKLPDEIFANPELLALMNQGLFGVQPSAADAMALQALLTQYKQPGVLPLAPGIHPFSPAAASALARQFPAVGTAENIEKSRHNLLVHDFKTKQQLLQQPSLPGIAAAAAAAGAARLPFVGTSLQAAVAAQNQPVSIGIGSAGMPPRHSDSPASLDRFNFIPQHGSISSQGSPHRSETSKTPNPQSPSSPHTAMKGHMIQGLMGLPHEGLIHPGIERRQSGSPHVPSPSDHRSLSMGAVSVPPDPRHQTFLASLKNHPVGKYSHSMPEGLAVQEPSLLAHNPFGSTPHLVRQTTSPFASQRPKSVKQERSSDLHPPADPQRRYTLSPDQARAFATSSAESNRPIQRWETHASPTSLESAHKMAPKQAWLGSSMVPSASESALKEAAEKQMYVDSTDYASHMQQEKAVKDLKMKGRATITPKLLINTIIDLNINQYAADKTKQKEPEVLPLSQALERKMSEGHIKDLKVTEPVEQKRYSVGSKPDMDKNNPHHLTRTTTLLEHSSDIIVNMYKVDPNKAPASEFKPDPSKGSHRFFSVPSNMNTKANDDQQSKRTDVARSNLVFQTLAPQMGDMPLEMIIKKALSENSTSLSTAQNPPISEAVRQNRPNSASGMMIPGMRHGAGTPFQPKTTVASFQSSSQEQKRTVEASHFGRNSPAGAAQPMFSALSLRKNPPNCPTQQIPPPSVSIPGRPPVLPGASNAPGGLGTTGVYHPQAPLPPTERASIPANEYEPLSDDDM